MTYEPMPSHPLKVLHCSTSQTASRLMPCTLLAYVPEVGRRSFSSSQGRWPYLIHQVAHEDMFLVSNIVSVSSKEVFRLLLVFNCGVACLDRWQRKRNMMPSDETIACSLRQVPVVLRLSWRAVLGSFAARRS